MCGGETRSILSVWVVTPIYRLLPPIHTSGDDAFPSTRPAHQFSDCIDHPFRNDQWRGALLAGPSSRNNDSERRFLFQMTLVVLVPASVCISFYALCQVIHPPVPRWGGIWNARYMGFVWPAGAVAICAMLVSLRATWLRYSAIGLSADHQLRTVDRPRNRLDRRAN